MRQESIVQNISPRALMMAIQAMNQVMNRLQRSIEASEDGDPDDYDMLLAYSKSEAELKDAYVAACRQHPDLPPYEGLVEAACNNP